jgi:integrating conjugative element membrane protein (TIGR03745 family)
MSTTQTPLQTSALCRTSSSARIRAARRAAQTVLLWPAVTLLSHPAWAALPTMPTPGTDMKGEQVAQGNWLGAMSAWFKAGLAVLGLVLVGYGFLLVVSGALTKWRDYSKGKADLSDLKEYFIMGAVLTVFLVMMVTYAFQVIGEA